MANFSGFRIPSGVVIRSSNDRRPAPMPTTGLARMLDLNTQPRVGAWAQGNPPTQVTLPGHFLNDHTETYYNTIIFDPPVLNVGTVAADTTVGFTFLNGFLHHAGVTISSFQVENGSATLVGRQVGDSFNRLENYSYALTIPSEGEGEIAMWAVWTFSDGQQARYFIQGNRTIASVFTPEYPATELLTFKSAVSASYTQEFRGSLRKHPRHTAKFKYILTGDELSTFLGLLYEFDTLTHTLPLWREGFVCGALPAGVVTIPQGNRQHDLIVNQDVVLFDPPNTAIPSRILAITAEEMSLPALAEATSSSTMIIPTLRGFVRKAPKTVIKSRDVATMDISIESGTFYQWEGAATADILTTLYGWEKAPDGKYLWGFPNYVHGGAAQTAYTERVFLDNTVGLVDLVELAEVTREFYTLNVSLHTAEEVTQFKRVMYWLNGKVRDFRFDTNRQDLILTQLDLPLGATAIDISAVTGAVAYTDEDRMIKIQYKDGSYFHTSAYFNNGELITIAPGMDREVLNVAEEIDFVCFAPLVRLNTDVISIKHESHARSTCKLPVVTIL